MYSVAIWVLVHLNKSVWLLHICHSARTMVKIVLPGSSWKPPTSPPMKAAAPVKSGKPPLDPPPYPPPGVAFKWLSAGKISIEDYERFKEVEVMIRSGRMTCKEWKLAQLWLS